MTELISKLKRSAEAAYSLFDAMAIGLATMIHPPVTVEYPDRQQELPPRSRMQLHNKIDDCIGCLKCAVICPVDCIDIETIKASKEEDLGQTSTGNPKRLWLTRFDIDMFKCCYCNLCTYVCPTECLEMTPKFEKATYDRRDGLYRFGVLEPEKIAELKERQRQLDEEKQRRLAEKQKAKEAEAKEAPPPDEPTESGVASEEEAPTGSSPADQDKSEEKEE